ncbi:MAG: excinuclease ABC subunit UvrA, partial [Chthoniobacter sp.]|uniref:excinuclease ABC subunit UvrA n=1 Tax=Chthoniobacter sp. TaxID=2510640 RepID=UPI0032A90800
MKKPKLTAVPDPGVIEIRGARQNNLKGFDLDVPLGKLNVVSGPSGSGKSSLAFDTIYAEGQRRYVETFSPYTRQFLDRMDKPQVDEIRGIPPAIAIEQSNPVKTTRSTVGTMTEINDYLKLLFPRLAQAFCPSCAREIRVESAKSIVDEIFATQPNQTVLVTFGIPVPPKTKPADFFDFLKQQGYVRIWLDEESIRIDEPVKATRLPAIVPVIQDRITVNAEGRSRLMEALETALRFGKGKIAVYDTKKKTHHPFSTGWHCAHCDLDITPPTPGLFSFNHPLGACPTCRGFGRTIAIDLQRAIPDRSMSIAQGVVKPFQTENGKQCQRDLLRCARAKDIDTLCPFEELPKAEQDWIIYGEDPGATGEELADDGLWYGVKGFFDWLESKSYKMHVRVLLSRYRNYTLCPDCKGGRYQPATMNFRLGGKTLPDLMSASINNLSAHIEQQKTRAGNDASTTMLIGEVASRLGFLLEVGLGYLSLDRPTRTLSGGEVERVNLTTCLGASLVNTLFVLDEPSIGLHSRDTTRLIRVMQQLRDKGNTLLVVEHDEAVIRAADNLIELGPGRGAAGGELVFNGSLSALEKKGRTSLTADYLMGRKSIPVPAKRRVPKAFITAKGASEHNLQNIDVEFPLGVFACVTGVSGSGKSTLVHDVLYANMIAASGLASEEAPGAVKKLLGGHKVEEVVMVDQSPLARTPRSSPALYLGVFDGIRDLFASTPEAVAQGLAAGAFSFNAGAGRCERCGGMGYEKIEMQFLSDVFIRCAECDGKRYQPHILAIEVCGKSIHDVLSLTVTEAIRFFRELGEDRVVQPLVSLEEVGLGYLTLGQPLNVLSGGESQRLKLVERLVTQREEKALLIFDEPTTGLHFDDVALLVRVFDRLVEQGNSLLVIEHNLEVIKCADWVIDLGPEAGDEGGLVVAVGTPEEVSQVDASHTGRFLRTVLESRTSRHGRHGLGGEEWSARVAEEPPSNYVVRCSPTISVHGAREHNLKNLSLDIPRDKM